MSKRMKRLIILFLLLAGGYLIVGASNVYNQILEKDLDLFRIFSGFSGPGPFLN